MKLAHGMIFVYLGDHEPPEFDGILADLEPFLAPHEWARPGFAGE